METKFQSEEVTKGGRGYRATGNRLSARKVFHFVSSVTFGEGRRTWGGTKAVVTNGGMWRDDWGKG